MPTDPTGKTVAIVPTYNECENIQALIEQLLELPIDLHVIVVDDNSPDGTGDIADSLTVQNPNRVSVIHRPGKLGLGTAYVAGFKKAIGDSAEYVFTMDADFSHNPRYMPSMLEKAHEGFDLVIGSRYAPGGGTRECTLPRKFLSWGANGFARTMLGLRARDTTAGFRCYRHSVLETVGVDEIRSSGYSFLIEMLYRTQRRGWKVGEVPIVFDNRRLGKSKISRREIIRALYTVLRLAWETLLGKV